MRMRRICSEGICTKSIRETFFGCETESRLSTLPAQVVAVLAVDRPATGGVPAAPQVTDLRFRVDWVKGGDATGGLTCSTTG